MPNLGILKGIIFVAVGCASLVFYVQRWELTFRAVPLRMSRKAMEKEQAAGSTNKLTAEESDLKKQYHRDVPQKFVNRLTLLHSRCPPDHLESCERSQWFPRPHLLVDVPKRLLVCVVPKSGSSTWHGLMWALRRKRAGLDEDQQFYTASDTTENHAMSAKLSKEDGTMLGTYKSGDEDIINGSTAGHSHRLILARHPFARLIPGWKDKFRIEQDYWKRLLMRYPKLEKYRVSRAPTNFSMSFEDFARYIADNGQDMRNLDYHFKTANFLCKPCNYAYTYILKAERVDDDQPWLMKRLNLTDMHIVRRGVSKRTLLKQNPSDSIKEMFKNLPMEVIKKLFLVYEKDFRYFGYTFDLKSFESGGFE